MGHSEYHYTRLGRPRLAAPPARPKPVVTKEPPTASPFCPTLRRRFARQLNASGRFPARGTGGQTQIAPGVRVTRGARRRKDPSPPPEKGDRPIPFFGDVGRGCTLFKMPAGILLGEKGARVPLFKVPVGTLNQEPLIVERVPPVAHWCHIRYLLGRHQTPCGAIYGLFGEVGLQHP